MDKRFELPVPPTREQVLRVTANSCMALYHESLALAHQGDYETRERFLIDRVRLVATLPARLADDRLEGPPLSSEDMRFINDLAVHGQRILENIESGIPEPGIGVFLVDRGTRIGGPTVLDQFVERVFPSHEAPKP